MKKENKRLTVEERKLLKRRVTELMYDMGILAYEIGYEHTKNAIIKAFENLDFVEIIGNGVKAEMKKQYVGEIV